jgi:hypothetical protein
MNQPTWLKNKWLGINRRFGKTTFGSKLHNIENVAQYFMYIAMLDGYQKKCENWLGFQANSNYED